MKEIKYIRNGYNLTYLPNHPRADNRGRVLTHIIIAEKALGRYINFPIEIHHFDSNKSNNKNNNLVICENKSYHKLLHIRQKILKLGGDPNLHKICSNCGTLQLKNYFHINNSKYDKLASFCKSCNLK